MNEPTTRRILKHTIRWLMKDPWCLVTFTPKQWWAAGTICAIGEWAQERKAQWESEQKGDL